MSDRKAHRVDLQITGAAISKVATFLLASVVASIITLLSWNVYTVHTLTNSFAVIQTNQSTVIEKLTDVADSNSNVQRELTSLVSKVDRIDEKLVDLDYSDKLQDNEITTLKVRQAERGGPNDPTQVEVSKMSDRLNEVEKKIIRLESKH